jgi:type II secretory pathway pseudopilin PulG
MRSGINLKGLSIWWKGIPIGWLLSADSRDRKLKTPNLKPSAFTLIEIVLSIGILSFALVGILALFPVALETAKESKEETMMAQIAQSIEADIRRADTATARVLATGFNPATASTYESLSLDGSGAITLAYGTNGRPWTERPTPAQYASGFPGPDFIARVETTFDPPEHPGLTRIDITVESPAAAPEAARRKVAFVTLKRLP